MNEAGRLASGKAALLSAVAVCALWVLATYLLEGRVGLLQQPNVVGRIVYGLVANVIIGTVVAGWALRIPLSAGVVTIKQLGFRSMWGTIGAVAVAALAGLGFLLLQVSPSTSATVLANVFAQVLPTSIAEVIVCWAVVGAVFAGVLRPRSKTLALLAGIVVADLVFGIYHFAHSAPFNHVSMVLFLMIPGLVTSLVYFLGRNLYAAIAIQNFFGTFGVMRGIEDLSFYGEPLYAFYALALLAVIALVGVHVMLRKLRHQTDTVSKAESV